MTKVKVLFIGNFLSLHKGTKGISEKLFESKIIQSNIEIYSASNRVNKIVRLSEMIFKTLLFRGDLVHIDVFSGSAFFYTKLISRIAVLRRKKVLMTLHGGALPEYFEARITSCKKTLHSANKILTPSKFLQSYFNEKGFDIKYLPNSIDLEKFPFKRDAVKKNSLLWVRAFTNIYNPEVPVRILHELRKPFPDVSLTMVGPDKGTLHEVEALINSLDLEDHINITGPIPNEELKEYYQSHSVYLNTTSFESFGVAVLEAASCGIPIVSNAVGEIPLIWKHGENILLVKENNISEFCEHIKRLFTDVKFCREMSRAASEKSLKFSNMKIEHDWVMVLNKAFKNINYTTNR